MLRWLIAREQAQAYWDVLRVAPPASIAIVNSPALRSTAGLITGAALIMASVFMGIALGELVMFQQMGFGLAVAVMLDATIVRSVLVPAAMELLGERNWYLPSALSWLPELRTEGPAEPAPSGAEAS